MDYLHLAARLVRREGLPEEGDHDRLDALMCNSGYAMRLLYNKNNDLRKAVEEFLQQHTDPVKDCECNGCVWGRAAIKP